MVIHYFSQANAEVFAFVRWLKFNQKTAQWQWNIEHIERQEIRKCCRSDG
jgi:hypothetical protein